MLRDYRNFYSLVRFLKKEVPKAFSIRRVKCPRKTLGDCVYYKRQYFIRIERSLPEDFACDVLVHEVAHCLSWHSKDKDDHGSAWGRSYAKVYRAYQRWMELS